MLKRLRIVPMPEIKLIDLDRGMIDNEQRQFFIRELYTLLEEREKIESISHKEMPSWQEHLAFVRKMPYKQWLMILNSNDQMVGATYITDNNEIGISIFLQFRRKGYAKAALIKILDNKPDLTMLANIAPRNKKSRDLFKSLGFKLVQHTYRRN